MSDGGFSKSKSKKKSRVQIPDFLQPFVDQMVGTAGSALSNLSDLQGTDRVADMTPQQLSALATAQARAQGAGGFLPTYQNQLLNTAQGVGLDTFLPQTAMDSLSSFGRSGSTLIPPELMQSLTTGANGEIDPTSFATLQAAQSLGLPIGTEGLLNSGSGIPAAAANTLSEFTGGRTPLGQDTLNQIRGGVTPEAATSSLQGMLNAGSAIPDVTRDALEATARGDFLYGGEGFDRAIEAAMNTALPQMRSIFGRSAGGATGGLAQESIGRAIGDTFASQYGQERGLQQNAAQLLGNLSQTDAQRRAQQNLSAASQLGNQAFQNAGLQLGAQGQLEGQSMAAGNQQLNAAQVLGQLGLTGQGQSLDALSRAAGLDLQGRSLTQDAASTLASLGLQQQGQQQGQQLSLAQLIGQLSGDERNRELAGAETLARLGDTERNRQLAATSALPDAAVADTNLLGQVGQMLQQQQQQELSGQEGFSQMLLAAALSGLPLQSLLGINERGQGSSFSLGGTATI